MSNYHHIDLPHEESLPEASTSSGMQQGNFRAGFYESSSSEGSSDGENPASRAHAKGEKRLASINDFLSQSPEAIKQSNLASQAKYNARYRTEIQQWRGTEPRTGRVDGAEASTFVQGAPDRDNPAYLNMMYVRGAEHTFQGSANFKERPTNLDGSIHPDHSPANYPVGSGRYDAEVARGDTQPIPNSEILFNQTLVTRDMFRSAPPLSQQERTRLAQNDQVYPEELANFDMTHYEGTHIINARDQRIMDQLIPEDEGSLTFHRQDRGYGVMAGGDTIKAKFELAARQGKDVTSISIEKKIDEDDAVRYNTYFEMDRLHPDDLTQDNGKMMINEQTQQPYIMTGARQYDAQVRQFGSFREANPQEAQAYARQLETWAGEDQRAGHTEEAQRLMELQQTIRNYYTGNA